MKTPELIQNLEEELRTIIEKDKRPSISIQDAAELLGMDISTLRDSIANNTCPFGIGGRHQQGSRFGKVSKLALWNWITKGERNN